MEGIHKERSSPPIQGRSMEGIMTLSNAIDIIVDSGLFTMCQVGRMKLDLIMDLAWQLLESK
jgi:hypothetical protein